MCKLTILLLAIFASNFAMACKCNCYNERGNFAGHAAPPAHSHWRAGIDDKACTNKCQVGHPNHTGTISECGD